MPIQYKTLKKFEHKAGPSPVEFLEISSSSETEAEPNVQDESQFQADDSHVRFRFVYDLFVYPLPFKLKIV